MRPGPWTCAALALAALAADEVLRPDIAHAPGLASLADEAERAPRIDEKPIPTRAEARRVETDAENGLRADDARDR